MKPNHIMFSRPDLLSWSGEISRSGFLLWSLVLFSIKYNLDRLLLYWISGRNWSVFSYFEQPVPGIHSLSPAQTPTELFVLLLASLPFLWVGLSLCFKRLRAAKLPLWLALLFVIPILKWFLFCGLALVPDGTGKPEAPGRRGSWLPKSMVGSAVLAVAASVSFATVAAIISTMWLREYGWGLFVGVPFCMGFFSSLIYGEGKARRLSESLLVATASVGVAGALLLLLAFEGLICLVMAAPLALVLALIGAVAGHVIQASRRPRVPPQVFCIPILATPLMFGSEILRPAPPPLLKIVTAIEVDAPMQTVWRHVVEFTELPNPTEPLFRLGIAYPVRAEIHGHGPGAVRECIFSTGPFVEPIETWDEPRLLKFSVQRNPAPLEEWTPYRRIHPPHLEGFLVSKQGQFLLTPLSANRTRLEGTTWYQHRMWPVSYWQLWSDQIIHSIHRRVLEHIKKVAERDSQ